MPGPRANTPSIDKIIADFKAGRTQAENVLRVATSLISRAGLEDAERLLRQLQSESRKYPTIAPNEITYSTVILAYANAGKAAEARKMLDNMLKDPKGPQPNEITYSTVISSYAKAGRADKAEEMLREMLKEPKGPQPNEITYNTVISAYAKAGRADKAEEMLREMLKEPKGPQPNEITYSTVISAFLGPLRDSQADRDIVPHLLNQAVQQGIFRRDEEVDLGYSKTENTLDLHEGGTIVKTHTPDKGLPSDVAKALFDYHWGMYHIKDGTVIVVGSHGDGSLRRAMADRLQEKTLYYIDCLQSDIRSAPPRIEPHHLNRGRLQVCDPRKDKPDRAD